MNIPPIDYLIAFAIAIFTAIGFHEYAHGFKSVDGLEVGELIANLQIGVHLIIHCALSRHQSLDGSN